MQVDRAIHLGPQHPVHLFLGQRGDHTVVEHTGRVDHRGQLRDLVEQAGQRAPVSNVAGHHPNPRAESDQLTRVAAATTGQHQRPDAVLDDQMSGHEMAECSGSAGDQHGAGRSRLGRRARPEDRPRYGLCQRNPGQPGHQNGSGPHCQLRLTSGDRAGQHAVGLVRAVNVDQDEPVGVLGLRGAHQPPHRGEGQRGHVLVGSGGQRALGEEHQLCRCARLVRQPGTQLAQYRVDS